MITDNDFNKTNSADEKPILSFLGSLNFDIYASANRNTRNAFILNYSLLTRVLVALVTVLPKKQMNHVIDYL